jgi:N-acetylglucosamine transport system substrate-binding protein
MDKSSRIIKFSCLSILILMVFASCGVRDIRTQANTALESENNGKSLNDKLENNNGRFKNKNLEVSVFEGAYGRKYWDTIIEKFEDEYPGVKVTLTASPKITEILRPRFMSGDVPDFLYGGTLPDYVEEGLLMDLDDVFNSKALDSEVILKDKFMPASIDYCKPKNDEKMYYGPANYFVAGIFYNKAYFAQKDLKAPKTWDELLAMGEIAKKDGKVLFTYQGLYPAYNENIFWPALASLAGLDAVKDCWNYKKGAFDTEAVKKVMGVYETIAQKDYLLPKTVAMNHTQAQAEFLKGKALFCPNGSWFETEMKDVIPKENFEFGFLGSPVFNEDDQQYAYIGIETFAIPKNAKNPELAKEFLKYIYTDESVKLNAKMSGGIIPIKNAIEICKPFISASSYECYSIFDRGVLPVTFNYSLTPKNGLSFRDELFDSISDIMTKKMNAQQWSEKMEKVTEKLRN